MKRLRCISSDEAVPTDTQPTKPCSDCPFAREALPGWLGNTSADEWIAIAHGEAKVDCHALSGPQCAGIAIYRANVAKRCRDRNILVLPPDEERVFTTRQEFLAHHAALGKKVAR